MGEDEERWEDEEDDEDEDHDKADEDMGRRRRGSRVSRMISSSKRWGKEGELKREDGSGSERATKLYPNGLLQHETGSLSLGSSM